MAWEDRLLSASLNGVPFKYEDVVDVKGDRDVIHEFPGRDEPFVQKLGKAARPSTFRAFIIGEDYWSNWKDLEKELDKSETMSLIHPYRGTAQVKLSGTYEVTNTDHTQRLVSLRFTLVQEGLEFFRRTTETPAFVTSETDAAVAVLEESQELDTTAAPKGVLDSVSQGLQDAINGLQGVNSQVAAKLNKIDQTLYLLEEVKDDARRLLNTPQVLLNKLHALQRIGLRLPVATSNAVRGSTATVQRSQEETSAVSQSAFRSTLAIPFRLPAFDLPSLASAQEKRLLDEIKRQVLSAGVLYSAGAVAEVPLASRSEATSVQQEFYRAFSDVLALSGQTSESFEAIAQARDALMQYLVTQQASLPATTNYAMVATKPMLLVSYELYDDITRDAELSRRNSTHHPSYTPGGIDLEVLT